MHDMISIIKYHEIIITLELCTLPAGYHDNRRPGCHVTQLSIDIGQFDLDDDQTIIER